MIEFYNINFAYTTVNADGETLHKNGIRSLDLTIADGEFIVYQIAAILCK